MTDRRRRLGGAVGAAAVVLAAGLFFAPGAVGSVLPVSAVARSTALSAATGRALALGCVGVGCLLWVTRASGDDDPGPALPSVAAPDDNEPVVGGGLDGDVEATVEAAAAGTDRDEARPELRSLAVDALVHVDDCDRTTAKRRVEAGEWTDDPVAAAYLADGSTGSLRRRLAAQLRSRTTARRRVDRTVAAVEALLDERERGRSR